MNEITIALKAYVGSSELATIGGEKAFTWKSSSRTSVDIDRLREAHPEIVSKFSKVTKTRRFTY